MAVSLSSAGAVLRRGVSRLTSGKTTEAEIDHHTKEAGDLKPNAAFKRKFGIPTKAAKAKADDKRADSDYGFPMPPKTHPKAKRYAHAVLSRAHQAKDYDAADVAKQVRKANVVLYGSPNPTAKQKSKSRESAALREWLPITPKGSWEGTSEIILNAARACVDFGGGVDGQHTWCISIWASYPAKNAVVIANSESGKLWLVRYAIDDEDNVTFPVIKSAKSSITVGEALRKSREARAKVHRPIRESARTEQLTESVKFNVRVREVKADDQGASAVCVMLEEGAGNAVDGHYYLADCFESAAAAFEGEPSFADHADEIEERLQPGRSVRDMIGWWSDVHVEEADGKKLLIGTFNIESGNEFALNKMREAKRYAARYSDQPEKQYVGFSICAGGISESREIDGKTYNAVLRITEAGSTDMVTRAGAGGKMLSLKEAQRMGKSTDALAKAISQSLLEAAKKANTTISLTRPLLEAAVKEAGLELDDESMKALHGAVKNALSGKATVNVAKNKDGVDEDDDVEDDSGAGEDDLAGDDVDDVDDDGTDDDQGADDEDDLDDILDDRSVEAKRKEAARTATTATAGDDPKKLREQLAASNAENARLTEREKLRELGVKARSIIRELKVPAAARAYALTELLECKTEKAMRERAEALLEGVIRPIHGGDGVAGVPARARESAGSGLLSVSGIAE